MKLPSSITRQLREQFGLDESVFRGGSLTSVVRRRMEVANLFELEDYFRLLQQSRQEFLAFADELLVPESWFFRDGKPFQYLTEWARKIWLKQNPGVQLRILSVPCATGQEPYSIAMTLLKEGFPPQSFHIEAGDLSERFVAEARKGEFRKIAFRGDVAQDYAEFFEDLGEGRRRVIPQVRELVHFRQRNLLAPDFLLTEPPFHVIFCRNVLIYFSSCSRERAVANLMRGLTPDGVIFGGHADAIGAIDTKLQPTGPAGAFCFQRRAATADPLQPKPRILRPAPASKAPARPVKPLPERPRRNEATNEIIDPRKPTTDDLWTQVRSFANAGRVKEAESIASELIKQTPPSAEAFCTLGEIYMALRDYKQAEPLFRRAVYMDSRHSQSLFHLALLAERRGDHTSAERLRKRAQAADQPEVKA